MLDNSALIAPFCPPRDDGDTFIYTEMLDRGKKKGNNGNRLMKTFYHRSQAEFWEQWPSIKALCDLAKVRACTRLAPRSWKKVGKVGEEVPHDEPCRTCGLSPDVLGCMSFTHLGIGRHNLTAYLCCGCFTQLFGPATGCFTASPGPSTGRSSAPSTPDHSAT